MHPDAAERDGADPTALPTPPADNQNTTANAYDWTDELPDTEHVRFFKNTDWMNSPLGPLKDWDFTLRMFAKMVFADSRPATLYWGPHYVAVYNEHFMPLSGQAHPKLMGAPFTEGFPELWEGIRPMFELAAERGTAVDVIEVPMTVERNGYREEAFFTGNFTPIGGTPGHPDGIYNALFEITSQKLADRRTSMLNLLASPQSDLTPDSVCSHIIKCIETNDKDIPMAMIYQFDEEVEDGGALLRLRGQIGFPRDHPLLVDNQDLNSSEGLIPLCRQDKSRVISVAGDERFEGIDWRGFGEPSEKVAALALISGSKVFGYLIVGNNPRQPYNDACKQFHQDIERMVASVMMAAINADESRKRQQKLEADLAESNMKIGHLVGHASVGMVHVSLDGTIIWANDRYYDLSGHPKEDSQRPFSFQEVYLEDDLPEVNRIWNTLLAGEDHCSGELRLKRMYQPPIGDPVHTHIQVMGFAYKEGDKVKSIMACTTDISHLKWAEAWQARLAQDARDAKRQQEAFIDVVSHEMRNPLSAIVHCADSIAGCVDECRAKKVDIPELIMEVLEENASAAAIIMDCANHQKRIIDDVLTLSKLDSTLLSVTPSAVRPSKLINSIVSIFEPEFRSNNIKVEIAPDTSMSKLNIEKLCFDPSRITQIFINLLTNAIKFVKAEQRRQIILRFGAATTDPRSTFRDGICWATKGKNADDVISNAEWGSGEPIFLTLSISDTGIGMTDKEIRKIFERFQQANVKTHVKYGGSGLGLFISKELTEKQGGEIGVASAPGIGSTFVFYIKTRRDTNTSTALPVASKLNSTSSPDELRVLLVEDNVINQQVLRKQLSHARCVVDVANHGIEALDVLATKRVDVVLMDMQMPVMDGLTCTREIRKRQEKGDIATHLPVIAVTANVRQEQIDDALESGADRVVQKPFKAADLVELMRELVSALPAAD